MRRGRELLHVKELEVSSRAHLDEAVDIYERFLKLRQPDRFRLGVTLKETGDIVGTIGLQDYSRRDRRAEIGYDLAAEHWGKGIMTEAVECVVEYGFREMALNRIEATMDSKNVRSVKLLEMMGFTREGYLKERYFYRESTTMRMSTSFLRGSGLRDGLRPPQNI